MRERDETPRAPVRRREQRDISVRAVGLFFLGLFMVTALVSLAMWATFRYLAARADRADPPRAPLGGLPAPPPEPRLQTTPRRDLEALRAEEDAILTSYGWIDRDAGIVRIPITRAMALLVERARESGTPPPPATTEPVRSQRNSEEVRR